MVNVFGSEIPINTGIEFGGLFGNNWLYVFIICFLGLISIGVLAFILFQRTWNKRVELYENVGGGGFSRIETRKARIIKLPTGAETLKVLGGGYLSATGRKVSPNTYMFVKGEDGYWYNAIHGDFDAKRGMLDVEPIDRDVRQFHVAQQKYNRSAYEEIGFWQKHGATLFAIIVIAGLLIGIYLVAGEMKDTAKHLAENDKARIDADNRIADAIYLITERVPDSSGIVPVNSSVPNENLGEGT